MNKSLWHKVRDLWRADLFTPKDFLRRALVICVVFLAAHLAGLREFTSVLNGTVGSLAVSRETAVFLGLFYIIVYLAFVILVPTLLLAAAILVFWQRFLRRSGKQATLG